MTILVFSRISAMVTTMPIFGYGQVSGQIRIMFSIILTLLLVPIIAANNTIQYTDHVVLFLDVIREVFIGLLIGFGARVVFEGFAMAGSFIGLQMGMAIMNIFDPSSEQQQPFISTFWLTVMIIFFLVTNSHYFLVETLFQNFAIIKLGTATFKPVLGLSLLEAGRIIYNLALQFAAPTMVIMLLVDVSIAFMARVMPQLNIFFISLPLKIGLGIFLLIISLKIFQTLFGHIFNVLETYVLTILSGFGGR